MSLPWEAGEQDWRVRQGIDPGLQPSDQGRIDARPSGNTKRYKYPHCGRIIFSATGTPRCPVCKTLMYQA